MEEYDKLHAAEDVVEACWEKEEPFCASACPFHYDVREFITRLRRGSFNSAFRTFYNGVAFPELVARLCPGYCRRVCPRDKTDQPVDLPRLEEAAVRLASNTKPTSYNMPAKSGRFAIVGGGISGLGCALRLCQRKYQVTLFEQGPALGGELLRLLPETEVTEMIDRQFMHESFELRLNTRVDDLQPLLDGFDAVYVATGSAGDDFGLSWSGAAPAAADRPGCFVGGRLTGVELIPALAQGLAAATLLENYLKTGVMRGSEEHRPTRMQLDESALTPTPAEAMDGPYDKEQAEREAGRCLTCRCDACIRHCPMMNYFEKFPLRIRDEVHVTVYPGTLDHDGTVAQRLISTCSQCGLCGEVCPQDIDMGDFLRVAHQIMNTREAYPWAFHQFWLRDMEHSLSPYAALAAAPGERPAYVFFPGCQTGASEPRYVTEAYALLRELEPECGIWLSCCGAPAVWAGREDLQQQVFDAIKAQWHSWGRPTLLLSCPTCLDMFERYLPELKVMLLTDFLWERQQAPARRYEAELAVFDPCPLRGRPDARAHIRALAEQAGCLLSELPYHGERAQCCSFGGQINDTNPPYAQWLADERAGASPLPYLVSCANCRDVLQSRGKHCVHILDLLLGLDRGTEVADVNQRLAHREQVKQEIVSRWFPEREGEVIRRENAVELEADPQVRAALGRKRIRLDDAAQVIARCEAAGRVCVDELSGHSFAYAMIGPITLWTEYTPLPGGGYRLHNAYQHRMKIESEDK
ncbi:MAG: NAD(P)-binding protein [Firmicutes bacterium]|nr:NAD(P)-binding protein [Bacillota bacterium]